MSRHVYEVDDVREHLLSMDGARAELHASLAALYRLRAGVTNLGERDLIAEIDTAIAHNAALITGLDGKPRWYGVPQVRSPQAPELALQDSVLGAMAMMARNPHKLGKLVQVEARNPHKKKKKKVHGQARNPH